MARRIDAEQILVFALRNLRPFGGGAEAFAGLRLDRLDGVDVAVDLERSAGRARIDIGVNVNGPCLA